MEKETKIRAKKPLPFRFVSTGKQVFLGDNILESHITSINGHLVTYNKGVTFVNEETISDLLKNGVIERVEPTKVSDPERTLENLDKIAGDLFFSVHTSPVKNSNHKPISKGFADKVKFERLLIVWAYLCEEQYEGHIKDQGNLLYTYNYNVNGITAHTFYRNLSIKPLFREKKDLQKFLNKYGYLVGYEQPKD